MKLLPQTVASCKTCPYNRTSYISYSDSCLLTGQRIHGKESDTIPDWCPLEDLPKPDSILAFPPENERAEIKKAENKLIDSVSVSMRYQEVTVRFNDGTIKNFPFEFFDYQSDGPKPDFENPKIIDFGQTLQLGDYEVAADVFYEEVQEDQ